MARPREFDETRALDAAIDCFWRRGYAATSVRDLAAAMGIGGTSLYNAFGDKRALFARALERYLDRATRARIARLEAAHPPAQALARFFAEIVDRAAGDRDRRGCFLINSAVEIAPHDAELGVLISRRLGEVEAFFRRTIVAGQAAGEFSPEADAADVARLLLGVLLGIRVLARSDPRRDLLDGMVRPALALLAPDPSGAAAGRY